MLRKEGLQAALEEARAPAKRAKHTGGTPQARKEHQEHLEHDLQASLHSVRPDGQARPLPGTICAELMQQEPMQPCLVAWMQLVRCNRPNVSGDCLVMESDQDCLQSDCKQGMDNPVIVSAQKLDTAWKQRAATPWLQKEEQHISKLAADRKDSLSHLATSVVQLTMHAVGFNEAKRPPVLSGCRAKSR